MTGAGFDLSRPFTTVGVLGGTHDGRVDHRGRLAPRAMGWELDWWIGADDRWHVPSGEAAVRQHLVDDTPVVHTAMRIPGGDAVQRIYGAPVAESGEVVVVEVANESPAPFVAALVVRGASAIDLDAATVYADGRAALHTTRPPSRWAVTADGRTEAVVTSGDATDAPFVARSDRGGRLVAAFLYPVAHRTTLRTVVALGPRGIGSVSPMDLPDADAVARGWHAQLDRGMRVEVPDEQLQRAIARARIATVLAGQAWRVDAEVVAVLEDWGLDAEAAVAWSRLTGRARRRLRRRAPATGTWDAACSAAAPAETHTSPHPGVHLLAAVRAVIAREGDGTIALLDDWPARWVGAPFDVRDAPTRRGPVSCSVRWHGTRPALLWDGPTGVTFTAPGLDPTWSSSEPHGEVLLAASELPRTGA